eukprot:GSMAST32.ASY1.ANO1.1760.1 assembled CDS
MKQYVRNIVLSCNQHCRQFSLNRFSSMNTSGFVSCEWLHKEITKKTNDLIILDATWFMPNSKLDAKLHFEERRIPGARFFDIDSISDLENDTLPHMLPTNDSFINHVRSLGIKPNSTIVVYDTHGIFSAPRVWYTFRLFGIPANRIAVLNGGLPFWISSGFPLEKDETQSLDETQFQQFFKKDSKTVFTMKQMIDNITSNTVQVVDARSPGRFNGTEPEPRKHNIFVFSVFCI